MENSIADQIALPAEPSLSEPLLADPVPTEPALDEPALPVPPPAKKRKMNYNTLSKYLNKRKTIEHSIFRWRDVEDSEEYGDRIFRDCKLTTNILNSEGAVLLCKGHKVARIELLLSKSAVVFFPRNSVAASIVCPLSFGDKLVAEKLV